MDDLGNAIIVWTLLDNEDGQIGICFSKTSRNNAPCKPSYSKMSVEVQTTDVHGVLPPPTITSISRSSGSFVYNGMAK